MPTLTASAYSRVAREAIPGVNSITIAYNSGSTEVENSATKILLARLPNHCKVLDIIEYHTTGAASCPISYGVGSDIDALATDLTQAVTNRATAPMPIQISLTDTSIPLYEVFHATATPGTATASLKLSVAVLYQPNSPAGDL